MSHQIPVTVIGGYLGSGKTTLVNHLLRNANGKRLAVMVNEFGELPIDEDLIEASSDDIISLTGGCVCCSYGSDLIEAMHALSQLNPAPDNVLLETSGVALPGSIAGTISLLPGFSLDGVVVLADAEKVVELAADKYMSDTIERQLKDADLVLLNKIDLASSKKCTELRKWIPSMATNARVIEVLRSVVPPEVVLKDFVEIDRERQSAPYQHDVTFESTLLSVESCDDAAEFARCLIADYPRMVRAKGFVRQKNEAMKTIQIVGQRFEITAAPDDVETGVVVIMK